jgi:hypothetical protein
MSEYNVKNYQEQGGDRWVIGGEIDILSDGALKIAGTALSKSAAQLNAAPVRIISYEVENLDANGNISNRPIFYVPTGYKLTLTDILLLSQGTAASVDNDNTSVVDVLSGSKSIATATFNASVGFPAIATATSLGALSTYKTLVAGDVVKLSVTNGSTADIPGFVLELIGTIETA